MSTLLRSSSSGHLLRSASSGHLRRGWVESTLSAAETAAATYLHIVSVASGSKSDVWPGVRDNHSYSWSSLNRAETFWEYYSSTQTYALARCNWRRYNTTSRNGQQISGVKFNTGAYSRPTGAGSPMLAVATQSSSSPGSTLTWLKGDRNTAVSGTGSVAWTFTPLTLADNLFLINYIDEHEPATARNAVCYFTPAFSTTSITILQ